MEKVIPAGVSRDTLDFLQAAWIHGADGDLDQRTRQLIEAYYKTSVSLSDLRPVAQVTTRARVSQIIKSGMRRVWDSLPDHLKDQHPQDKVIQLKSGVTPETRAKMSEAHKRVWARKKGQGGTIFDVHSLDTS